MWISRQKLFIRCPNMVKIRSSTLGSRQRFHIMYLERGGARNLLRAAQTPTFKLPCSSKLFSVLTHSLALRLLPPFRYRVMPLECMYVLKGQLSKEEGQRKPFPEHKQLIKDNQSKLIAA